MNQNKRSTAPVVFHRVRLISLFILIVSAGSGALHAESTAREQDSASKANIWIPGLVFKLASRSGRDGDAVAQKGAGNFLKAMGSLTINIREGKAYAAKNDRKMERKRDRLNDPSYTLLAKVQNETTNVSILDKTGNKGRIKRIVVIADVPQTSYVMLTWHCRLKPRELSSLMQENANEWL